MNLDHFNLMKSRKKFWNILTWETSHTSCNKTIICNMSVSISSSPSGHVQDREVSDLEQLGQPRDALSFPYLGGDQINQSAPSLTPHVACNRIGVAYMCRLPNPVDRTNKCPFVAIMTSRYMIDYDVRIFVSTRYILPIKFWSLSQSVPSSLPQWKEILSSFLRYRSENIGRFLDFRHTVQDDASERHFKENDIFAPTN